MSEEDEGDVFGTASRDEPVKRADFERALRFLNMTHLDLRDTVLTLAAQVVSLTDELTRRLDGVEPDPAPPNTPAPAPTDTVEKSVLGAVPETLFKIQAADVRSNVGRIWMCSDPEDKYEVEGPDIPCAELIPLCKAACCKLDFPLSTQDLDEGVIRWDYGVPYMIRQRASDGFCVHNDPTTHGCTVHAQRPHICRKYDCRTDARVWLDYEKRIPTPSDAEIPDRDKPFDLGERVRRRANALFAEKTAIAYSWPEEEPATGPTPAPGSRLNPRR